MTEQELELPKGWITVLLHDIVKNERFAIKRGPFGSSLKKEFFVKSGYKVYEQQNAINNDLTLGEYYINEEKFQQLKNFEVKSGDMIISCSGTIGKIAVIPENIKKGIINQALLKISLNFDIMQVEFFSNLFQFWMLQAQIDSHGSGIGNLSSVKSLKKLPILLPPLNEQKRIVSKIKELFSKIDSAKQSLEHTKLQLELYVHSLPKSLFEGEHNEKWEKTTIGQVSKLYVPQRDKPKKFDGNIPWLRIEDFDGKYATDSKSNQRVSQKTVDKMNLRVYPIGTVLCSCSATLGVCAITKKPLITNQTFIGIFPNSMLNNEFLYYYMLTQINNLINIGQGGTIKYISRKKFENLTIKIPSLKEQEQIVSQIEHGFSLIENTAQIVNSTLQQLETMKISILKQAFEGKLIPQDPNDEPASVLLERIQKEKLRIRQ